MSRSQWLTFLAPRCHTHRTHAATSRYRQPSAEGELFTHFINNVTSYSFLTEMGAQHRPPYADALEECLRVLPMLIEFLADPVTVVGHVVDAATGAPLPARECDVTMVVACP